MSSALVVCLGIGLVAPGGFSCGGHGEIEAQCYGRLVGGVVR